jgi:hypothetical protein
MGVDHQVVEAVIFCHPTGALPVSARLNDDAPTTRRE